MIRRRAFVLALATLLGGTLAHGPACDAWAQDGGGGGGKSKKEPVAEKTAEEKELEAIGKEFKDKDVDALIARIPEKVGKEEKEGRVRLHLGRKNATYARTQAKNIIEDWLADRTITRVTLESTKDLVGTFILKFRPRGEEDEVERTLLIRIAGNEEDGFVLKELEVQAQ